MMENSFFSLAPPLFAILLAIYTKKIIPSLFLGLWLGSTIVCHGNPFLGFFKLFEDYVVAALASKGNATVLLYGAAFGGFIAILQKTGGAKALGNFFAARAKSSRLAELYAMIFGIFLFFDDYFSCLTVGSVMRPICDKAKVAREKLAFIVDSTAAPICLLVPVSTWVVYVTGLISKEIQTSANAFSDTSAILIYFKTIPLNFYSILALFGVALLIYKQWSFGPMKKAEDKFRKQENSVYAEEKQEKKQEIEPKISNLVFPMMVMFALLPFLFLYTGGYWKGENVEFWQAVGNAKGGLCILISVVVAGGTAIILGKYRGCFSMSQGFETYLDGMQSMYTTYIILILAWALGSLTKDIGTAKYVSSLALKGCPDFLVPALIFVIGTGVSFTTGTSYGTFAILMPIAVPLAYTLGIPVEYAIAAVLSGGIFGDHASPVSDTTILSSTGSGCDLMAHVITQLPYCAMFALCAILAFMILGLFHSILLSLLSSMCLLSILALSLHKNVQKSL
ncbi:MAG: Na+/H+ antiporter NhaC family protein [Candidatus Brocadiae bacterium]|nr:Na+/H+ antiporter NhaC family protein [Candidatus Brocadiia bacterium]